MHFGATLKLLRIDAGLSLRSLARQVGVSSAYLSRVENGRDPVPTPDRLAAIAGALHLAPEQLVELAHQTTAALADYVARVPPAGALFLEVARRDLGPGDIARLRGWLDREFPVADATPPVRLEALIDRRIVLGLDCARLDQVIGAGTACCVRSGPRRLGEVTDHIRQREAVSPTLLGNGIAVPHAVVPGMASAAALVTLAEPLALDTPDGAPVEVAVVLVSGAGGREHLEALAAVARLAAHGMAGELRAARTPARVRALIRRADRC